ncbi:hypothetical protein PHMEG_00036322 [Phytophthora megakarya]|uniref:Uncharacterized protein n=1 Tax=Phytophthora megakarya TaxID=4795 RepID=A0A225UM75_9STRA|nr:hypothetical protein PHMEG_00036322 [Phytophthora megakarya]
MVTCVVGDNCSSNQSIATKIGVPLVGCASHRINLAVNRCITEYEPLLAPVNTLMPKLTLVNNFAELAKLPTCILSNGKSHDGMLERYVRIHQQIRTVEAVEELVPTGVAYRKLLELLEHMKKFPSITKKLHTPRCERNANASIVHSPVFKAAAVKVINGGTISKAEAGETIRGGKILLAEPNKRPGHANYSLLLKELPPTSNACEFFYSVSLCSPPPNALVCSQRILNSSCFFVRTGICGM